VELNGLWSNLNSLLGQTLQISVLNEASDTKPADSDVEPKSTPKSSKGKASRSSGSVAGITTPGKDAPTKSMSAPATSPLKVRFAPDLVVGKSAPNIPTSTRREMHPSPAHVAQTLKVDAVSEKQCASPAVTATKEGRDARKMTLGDAGAAAVFGIPSSLIVCVLLPLSICMSSVIMDRTDHWRTESLLFRSALDVCPQSLKVLNNHGLLAMSVGQLGEAVVAFERASELYPNASQMLVNSGIAQHRLKNFVRSANYFEKALEVTGQRGERAHGYYGMMMLDWAKRASASSEEVYLGGITLLPIASLFTCFVSVVMG
jgi:hypothetical protein